MSEENINSQVEGKNSDEVEEEEIEEQKEDTQEGSSDEAKSTKKSKSNVPKILAEKNELKRKLDEANAKLEGTEFSEEKVQAMIQQAVLSQKQSELKQSERNNFIETYGEENIQDVEATLNEHPSLTYEQAAQISGIATFQPSNPNKYSMGGHTPASIKQKKTTPEKSDEELMGGVIAELQAMGLHNAR